MTPIIDADLARRAADLVWPALERAALDPAICGTGCLHVVVLDPARRPGIAAFEQAILHERSVNHAQWDADYAWYARKKAEIAWRTGCDSHVVVTQRPQLLREGDARVWGSVWLDGIVVGASGAQPWYDEAFALMIAAQIRALAKERMALNAP